MSSKIKEANATVNYPSEMKKANNTNGHTSLGNGVANGHTSNGNGISKDQEIMQFLEDIWKLSLEEGYSKVVNKQVPVVKFKTPQELGKIFDFNVADKGADHATLMSVCEKIIEYSVKTGHPQFYNQLYAGCDPYGFAGNIVTDVLNASLYTYEVSPVFVLCEKSIIEQTGEIIGWSTVDGTMCPGGSYSNMLGLNLARYKKFPNVKEEGIAGLPRLLCFTNEMCHYSNQKNAALMGLGTKNMVSIKSDEVGRMDLADLRKHVEEAEARGDVPFCVIATSGTTVLGAYDPLNGIADICEKHNIWMHVDGAWGGGAMFSSKHKHLFDGVERSDSVAWNMHKLPMAPQQCCLFVTKHPDILSGAHSLHVPYLFQMDKTLYEPSYDVGKKIIQCGRKVDAFKFWLMWKAMGRSGMEARINKSFDNAKHLASLVKSREGFHLLQEPECTNVCFYFVPKRMRSMKFDLSDPEFCQQISKVAPKIKERMVLEGTMMVGYQPLKKLPNFFRMITINDLVGHSDMKDIVDTIERLGMDL